MNSSQLIYNVPISCTHISSTVAGYINTCTFNLQTQLINKIDETGGSISS